MLVGSIHRDAPSSLKQKNAISSHFIRPTYNITTSLSLTLHLKTLKQANNFDLTVYEYQAIRLKLVLIYCHQITNMAAKRNTDVEAATVPLNVER
jgi:hypothetical protein